MNKKMLYLVSGLVILVVLGVVFSKTGLLTGNMAKRLAFFEEAPSKDKVIGNAFLSTNEAFEIFVGQMNDTSRVQYFRQNFAKYFSSSAQITRAEIMYMAVTLFGLTKDTTGPIIKDVPATNPYYEYISVCALNGCLDTDFKPSNSATKDFVQSVAMRLAR